MRDGKGTVTCQNSQNGVGNDRLQFTANNEGAVQTLKPSCAQKNALREFLVVYTGHLIGCDKKSEVVQYF